METKGKLSRPNIPQKINKFSRQESNKTGRKRGFEDDIVLNTESKRVCYSSYQNDSILSRPYNNFQGVSEKVHNRKTFANDRLKKVRENLRKDIIKSSDKVSLDLVTGNDDKLQHVQKQPDTKKIENLTSGGIKTYHYYTTESSEDKMNLISERNTFTSWRELNTENRKFSTPVNDSRNISNNDNQKILFSSSPKKVIKRSAERIKVNSLCSPENLLMRSTSINKEFSNNSFNDFYNQVSETFQTPQGSIRPTFQSKSTSPKYSANSRLKKIKNNISNNLPRHLSSELNSNHTLVRPVSPTCLFKNKNSKGLKNINSTITNDNNEITNELDLKNVNPIVSSTSMLPLVRTNKKVKLIRDFPSFQNRTFSSESYEPIPKPDLQTVQIHEQESKAISQKSCSFDPFSSLNMRPETPIDCEDMEWSDIVSTTSAVDQSKSEASSSDLCQEAETKSDPTKNKDVYLIIDTNVFLRDLSILKEILKCKSDFTKYIIYVPWMVINELDYMKVDRSANDKLKTKAQDAIKFINIALIEGKNLIGQSLQKMSDQQNAGKSPDDKIIASSLQAKKEYGNVMLVSNDINLKNKALINDIPACSASEILIKLVSKSKTNQKLNKILNKMSLCSSFIICECAKEAYGAVWNRMDMLKNPPWSLQECIKIFNKYKTSLFGDKLLKQFFKTIDDLSVILRKMNFDEKSAEYNKFTKLCISMCIYLKDMDNFVGTIQNTIRDINQINNS